MKTIYPLRTLVVAATFVLIGSAALAQGRIEVVGGDTYDWGEVAPSKVKTMIEIRNVGDDTLTISDVKRACGCTTAPIDKNMLLPGESGKIDVEVDMISRSGPTTKTITVVSNDPKNPAQVIYLKADVKRSLTFSPAEYFMVNDGKMGVESLASVRIANTGDQTFTLFPPELVQGNVKARFDMKQKRQLKPGEELELTAHVTPLEAGSANGIILLRTDSDAPGYQNKELSLFGSVAVAPTPPVKNPKPSMSNK